MFEVKVTMPSKNQMEKDLIDTIKKDITKKAGSIRCPIHNSQAKITITGNSISKLSINVSGCCQTLIDNVTKKIA